MAKCTKPLVDSKTHSGPCPHDPNYNLGNLASDTDRPCVLHSEKPGEQWLSEGNNLNLLVGLIVQAIRQGNADFRGAELPHGFSFDQVAQSGAQPKRCDFTHATFLGAVITAGAGFPFTDCDFSHARLQGDADFSGNHFHGASSFRDAQFLGKAVFNTASFSETADFRDAKFINETPEFDRTTLWNAQFDNAHFDRGAKFSSATFHHRATFNGARFGNWQSPVEDVVADFNGTQFEGKLSMAHAVFGGRVRLDTAKLKGSSSFRGAKFRYSPSIDGTEFKGATSFEGCSFRKGDEEAFRQIKMEMEKQGHFWQATLYYGWELSEQRKPARKWARVVTLNGALSLNGMFWLFSDYNRKWWLPLVWLAVSCLLFGFGYHVCGCFEFADEKHLRGWPLDLHNSAKTWQALFFSAQNLRIPWLFGRSVLIASTKWALLATFLQSVLDVSLLAMTIVAARRRFRIA